MIFVDPRDGSKHLADLFAATLTPYTIQPLAFGDCMFLGSGPGGSVLRIGIELKGGRFGSDFITSMQSGRLVGHQLPGLAEYDRRYLIIEGLRFTRRGLLWLPPRRGQMRQRPIFKDDVERFVTGCEESGVRVRYTTTPVETAHVITKVLFGFWSKDYDKHDSVSTLYSPPVFSLQQEDETTQRIRRVVVGLKAGVGVGRSKAVARTFGSVLRAITASEQAWAEVEGIGTKTAGEIVRAIRAEVTQVPNRSISKGRRRPSRSDRGAGKRSDKQLDAGGRAQRRAAQTHRSR